MVVKINENGTARCSLGEDWLSLTNYDDGWKLINIYHGRLYVLKKSVKKLSTINRFLAKNNWGVRFIEGGAK